ncbi:hypothetical protein HOE67_00520 [Candidatus Peregrinibacteria bacterium]|jgi:CheY-like chemotaxis protein|nr:hypothetical protein [Candidatus Peregrinibacteria bacterium]MBT4055573.1 hypothetical protein [Candidatus Peregrinibacteria bacterium]
MGGGERYILYADENPQNRRSVEALLDKATLGGARLLVSDSGCDARQLLIEYRDEIIAAGVNNYMDPVYFGSDASKAIRSDGSEIPVAIINAGDENETGDFKTFQVPGEEEALVAWFSEKINTTLAEA